jgi:hypothetical protein
MCCTRSSSSSLYGSLKVFDDDWLLIPLLFYIVNLWGTECMFNQFPKSRAIRSPSGKLSVLICTGTWDAWPVVLPITRSRWVCEKSSQAWCLPSQLAYGYKVHSVLPLRGNHFFVQKSFILYNLVLFCKRRRPCRVVHSRLYRAW